MMSGAHLSFFTVSSTPLAKKMALSSLSSNNLPAFEVIFIVDEVDLHSCSRDGCDFDDEWTVHIVDDDIDSGESYHLVELIFSLIDAPVSWHERPDFLFPFLDTLRQIPAYARN